MADRWDAVTPRKNPNTGKTYFQRIGTMFANDKGFTVILDALPLPDAEGQCKILMFEPKPKEGGGSW